MLRSIGVCGSASISVRLLETIELKARPTVCARATWSLRGKDQPANRGGTYDARALGSEYAEVLLYRSTGEHSEDCKRFPFERIPKRVFLDTNVINVLVKHCERVFDHAPIPVDADPTLAADIEALMHVFYVGARANWDILGSQKTLDELFAPGIARFEAISWNTHSVS